jgi:putative exporter of polyketide antibiotics
MTGTWALLRLALRRDRILLPAWIIGPAAMVTISVSATTGLYPTAASRVAAANTINATAALVALYGRIYDPTSIGALSLVKMTARRRKPVDSNFLQPASSVVAHRWPQVSSPGSSPAWVSAC